jgi:hypothetical protein
MSLYLYSINPFFSHSVWCSDQYDPEGAPSSSPCELFISLQKDCDKEDSHSNLINRYKKTFRKLVAIWETSGIITTEQKNEILIQ